MLPAFLLMLLPCADIDTLIQIKSTYRIISFILGCPLLFISWNNFTWYWADFDRVSIILFEKLLIAPVVNSLLSLVQHRRVSCSNKLVVPRSLIRRYRNIAPFMTLILAWRMVICTLRKRVQINSQVFRFLGLTRPSTLPAWVLTDSPRMLWFTLSTGLLWRDYWLNPSCIITVHPNICGSRCPRRIPRVLHYFLDSVLTTCLLSFLEFYLRQSFSLLLLVNRLRLAPIIDEPMHIF